MSRSRSEAAIHDTATNTDSSITLLDASVTLLQRAMESGRIAAICGGLWEVPTDSYGYERCANANACCFFVSKCEYNYV